MAGAVLVHGLYHRAEHFALVVEGLHAAGVDVVVPELHRGSLGADTAVVQAAVDEMDEPPVVLGHSYGGSVLTGLQNAAHLVYVAAFVLDAGESAASTGGATPRLRNAIESAPDDSTFIRRDLAADVFYADCPEDRAAWAVDLLRVQAPGCGRGVPERQSWKHTPSTYVVCARDRAIEPELQRVLARRCTSVREWPTGHSPFVVRPELVVDLMLELLRDCATPYRSDGKHSAAHRP
ncbi:MULTISPECIES: alpha/beta hydrolase [unclassified Streptomyces]|uniref:alpha/beta hydrolase n=1 Tax=unclassified Streptomyces TaxID=2593676 RepID=UPI0023651B4F|nr:MULTISPECIES: alpha/beta hydrolase [unclassified Streptomyces]MDF3139919.1 alpha/beta hydrolase [Streptomyces sp. T21Q-yed]WDF44006.1 alpha/beta hydrolase [Streptomyces sp. T12]